MHREREGGREGGTERQRERRRDREADRQRHRDGIERRRGKKKKVMTIFVSCTVVTLPMCRGRVNQSKVNLECFIERVRAYIRSLCKYVNFSTRKMLPNISDPRPKANLSFLFMSNSGLYSMEKSTADLLFVSKFVELNSPNTTHTFYLWQENMK